MWAKYGTRKVTISTFSRHLVRFYEIFISNDEILIRSYEIILFYELLILFTE
jgi:hypothetical protein